MKPMILSDFAVEVAAPQACTASSLISCENLSVYYGTHKALDGINIEIPEKRIYALMGPSGCGKTSLLYAMAGLLGQVPNARVSGSIQFKGKDLTDVSSAQSVRHHIGFVFQKPTPFPFSIYRNLELVIKEHGIKDNSEVRHRIESVLCRVGLWSEVKDRLHKSALALSGGQQQRLCMARALVLQPSVLLMDEPCSALDPISSGVIEELISDLGRNHSVILVTHNLAQAKRLSHDTAFFWVNGTAGVLIESGPTPHLFAHPKHELTAAYVSGARG